MSRTDRLTEKIGGILNRNDPVRWFDSTEDFVEAIRAVDDENPEQYADASGVNAHGLILINKPVVRRKRRRQCCILAHEFGHSIVNAMRRMPIPSQEEIDEYRRKTPRPPMPQWAELDPEFYWQHETLASAIEVASCPCQKHRPNFPILAKLGDRILERRNE